MFTFIYIMSFVESMHSKRCCRLLFGLIKVKLILIILLTIVSLATLNYLLAFISVYNNHGDDCSKCLSSKENNNIHRVNQYNTDNNLINKCEVIHVGVVSAGTVSNLNFHIMLKSIYFYRNVPIHFHVLVTNISKRTLHTLFDTWSVPQVNISFYNLNEFIYKISWIKTHHYSGVYGLLKLVFPIVLPYYISKIIILDTDIIFNTNIAELWLLFNSFNKQQYIGLVENESDFYLSKINIRWPAIGRGFNTGLILYDLKRMRDAGWNNIWYKIGKNASLIYGSALLADQDVINAVIKQYPEILFVLPCYWNIQLSDNTLSFHCYRNNSIKVIHWNSPRKINVMNKDGAYFRNMFTAFTEMNGNIFRTVLNNCSNTSNNEKNVPLGACDKINQITTKKWRTLLFFRKFVYTPLSYDVTLTAQFSYERIQILENLCQLWRGPMTLALYATDTEFQEAITFLDNLEILKGRTNIIFHVVFKEGEYYPINFLRNVCLEHIITPYVFLADIDFLPIYNLHSLLRQYIATRKNMYKEALVIPAFETQQYKSRFPRNKIDLLKMLRNRSISTFRYDVWASGHAPTNYDKWKTAKAPYKIKWKPNFEPYIVVASNITKYDVRFIGFGWNKVSHIMELEAQGYDFIVLPDVFIIHKPHAPSNDIMRFRRSVAYRRCLQKLKEEFIEILHLKYKMHFKNRSKISNEFE